MAPMYVYLFWKHVKLKRSINHKLKLTKRLYKYEAVIKSCWKSQFAESVSDNGYVRGRSVVGAVASVVSHRGWVGGVGVGRGGYSVAVDRRCCVDQTGLSLGCWLWGGHGEGQNGGEDDLKWENKCTLVTIMLITFKLLLK